MSISHTHRVKRALISVSDRKGLLELAQFLIKQSITLIATGRTATFLQEQNIPVITVRDYTGFPAIMGGRVKTLHPKIFGGILARPAQDRSVMITHDIDPIDLVIVNFYPFQQTLTEHPTFDDAIEQIDIGGPSLVRAAAKNHQNVAILTDPNDYTTVVKELSEQKGCLSQKTKRMLAYKAFHHTAHYDSLIQQYLQQNLIEDAEGKDASSLFPQYLTLACTKKQDLRYGENPHQKAAVYQYDLPNLSQSNLLHGTQHQGKPLSFNNLADGNAALHCVSQWPARKPACAIIKHATPCGVALAQTPTAAYQAARSTDPQAAFGGIIAFNCPIDAETAKHILSQFCELVIAPDLHPDALKAFAKKPNLRVFCYQTPTQSIHPHPSLDYRSIHAGLLAQTCDHQADLPEHWQVISQRQPTQTQREQLHFAWQVVRCVKSNAIVCANHYTTYGIGSGQVSRVTSVQLALDKARAAGFDLKGAVLASDAFFPFRDAVDLATKAGITAIIQTGGSKRDQDIIDAANEAHIVMLSTGVRHFFH